MLTTQPLPIRSSQWCAAQVWSLSTTNPCLFRQGQYRFTIISCCLYGFGLRKGRWKLENIGPIIQEAGINCTISPHLKINRNFLTRLQYLARNFATSKTKILISCRCDIKYANCLNFEYQGKNEERILNESFYSIHMNSLMESRWECCSVLF